MCSTKYASTTKIVHIMSLGDLDPFLPRSKLVTWGFVWEKLKIIYFWKPLQPLVSSKSIQLDELMKLNEYQRSRSFFDRDERSLRFQNYNLFFSEIVWSLFI